MIKLYHADGTRSLRVRWVLEELGVPYKLEQLQFPPRVRQPEYLKINSTGAVPTMHDGAVVLTESMAICQYLAHTYGPTPLVVDPGEPGYADYLQYCWYGEAMLMPPIGSIFRYTRVEPPERRPEQVVDDSRKTLITRMEPLRLTLESATFVAAGRLTLADVSVGYALALAKFFGEAEAFPACVKMYQDRLAQVPSYRRAYGLTPLASAAVI